MIVRMVSGMATQGPAFEAGDLVDWKPDAEAQRLVDSGLAESVEQKEIGGQKVKQYTSPPPRGVAEDRRPGPALKPARGR